MRPLASGIRPAGNVAGMRIALVLGAGGARGYTEIGVIQVLHEQGHEIVAIAGSSIGALVGGLEAAGKLDDYTDWVMTLTQRDLLRYLNPGGAGGGAFRLARVFERVSGILGPVRIENLPIPYTAVATDIEARREVWFQEGSLEAAIRASVAIPSFIAPVVVNDRVLVDGGVTNPVPIEPTLGVPADLTVAVSLYGPPSAALRPEPEKGWSLLAPLQNLSQRLLANDQQPEMPYSYLSRNVSVLDILSRSVDVMCSQIARTRMASNPPDVLISVPSDACATADFHRASEIIDLGRELAREALPKLHVEEPVSEPEPRSGLARLLGRSS